MRMHRLRLVSWPPPLPFSLAATPTRRAHNPPSRGSTSSEPLQPQPDSRPQGGGGREHGQLGEEGANAQVVRARVPSPPKQPSSPSMLLQRCLPATLKRAGIRAERWGCDGSPLHLSARLAGPTHGSRTLHPHHHLAPGLLEEAKRQPTRTLPQVQPSGVDRGGQDNGYPYPVPHHHF
eukprot:6212550-Pleurochrysis_carterae.AAC.1